MTNWLPDLEGRSGPLYLRLADRIEDDISAGVLLEGAKLPPQRDLAFDMGVHHRHRGTRLCAGPRARSGQRRSRPRHLCLAAAGVGRAGTRPLRRRAARGRPLGGARRSQDPAGFHRRARCRPDGHHRAPRRCRAARAWPGGDQLHPQLADELARGRQPISRRFQLAARPGHDCTHPRRPCGTVGADLVGHHAGRQSRLRAAHLRLDFPQHQPDRPSPVAIETDTARSPEGFERLCAQQHPKACS